MTSDELPVTLEATAVYVLNAEHVCHDCGCLVPVFRVMLAGPFKGKADGFDLDEDDAPLLSYLNDLPPALVELLTDSSLGYFRLDVSHTAGDSYWMNHCSECDSKIGDWFISRPGEAFFPTIDAEMAKVNGKHVPGPWVFTNPGLSVSSWTTYWLQQQSNGT